MKTFVSVIARFDAEGGIRPLSIEWENGRRYTIDRITRVCRAASLKSGGAGIRYTCVLRGQERYLFLEGDRWFIETAESV